MQISNNNPTNPHPHTHARRQTKGGTSQKHKPTHPDTPPHNPKGCATERPEQVALMLQDPTVCQPYPHQTHPTFHTHPSKLEQVVLARPDHQGSSIIDDSTSEHHHAPTHERGESGRVLLRKEVIQPHLPVRLPCYDFVPIASPTFDSSLPYGLGHRLRVLPTFVT
jgi:hypothetical protein